MNVMQARTCIEEAHSHPSHPFSNDNSCMDFGFAFESDLVFSQFEFTHCVPSLSERFRDARLPKCSVAGKI